MLEELKEEVLAANLKLEEHKLVTFTWGNVSGIDRKSGRIVIKPSGIEYSELTADKLVVLNEEGDILEGALKPSSDTPTHLYLYKAFPNIGGIVHTHSPWATSWAQSGRDIPVLGTTHADYFESAVPCTRQMYDEEIMKDYEHHTGKVIAETFQNQQYEHIPGVLVNSHGPFCWGQDALNALHNAVVLETVAEMAYRSIMLNEQVSPINTVLHEKHFSRKHGANAYYGQS